MINSNKYWGLDAAYNFDAIQQNMFLCFAGTVTPADTTTYAEDPTLLQTYGFYHTHTQFGYFALSLTPIERVTLHLGYSIVDNQGQYNVAQYTAAVGTAVFHISISAGGHTNRCS